MDRAFDYYRRILNARTPQTIALPRGKESAVLLPLSLIDGEEHLLLARRSDTLASHPGQICFPGGKPMQEDGSLLQTALRETQEELGIPENRLNVLGELDEVFTITGYTIKPFVAVTDQVEDLRPDPEELAGVFWVPVKALMDPANYRTEAMILLGGRKYDMQIFAVTDPPVWGATARIIRQMLGLVHGWEDPCPDHP